MSSQEDVYHPEWVAMENAMGGRYTVSGDWSVDIPQFDAIGAQLAKTWPPLEKELDIAEEVIQPENIRVRIYKIAGSVQSHDPLLLLFHGGGYIAGNLDTEDSHCRYLATKTPCVVVNVDYPLGPKHSIDEIVAGATKAVEWAQTHDPPLTSSLKTILAGGSAGAHLCSVLGYNAATLNKPANISGLVLWYPITSPASVLSHPYKGKYAEMHTSYEEKASGAPVLYRGAVSNLFAPIKFDLDSPHHFPLLASSLENYPRTYVVTAEHDPLRDDGRVLVKRLQDESANGVREHYYQGVGHYFFWFPNFSLTPVMMNNTVEAIGWIADG